MKNLAFHAKEFELYPPKGSCWEASKSHEPGSHMIRSALQYPDRGAEPGLEGAEAGSWEFN